ncbi:MAG TPA: tetratricopeptide repeat protein, partial [Candidatus Omnitrophota bacterium]|nr:tetratricopeptide repeat protein [Candidatus Omnitrophota bacterium]
AHQMMLDVLTRKEGVELPEEEMRVPEITGLEALSKSSRTLDRVTSLHQTALDLVAERRYVEAAKIYQEIVLTEPDDDQAYLIMGHVYLLSGSPGKAEEAFSNAVHIDPANIQEITPFYENIILQNPDDDDGYANLGFARIIVGDFLKAREAFLQALEINPDNPAALEGLSYLNSR